MRKPTNRGFTLIEMMVSMAAGSIVLILAVVSLRSTGDGYSRTTNGVSAEREARAGLTIAAEDLSKAVSGQEMIFGEGGEGWNKDRLGFLCLQPEDAQTPEDRKGDLCSVVYYLKDLEVGRDLVRCLMRGFRDSEETYDAIRAGNAASLYNERPVDEPVAFGVLSFTAEPLLLEVGGGWTRWTEAGDPDWEGPDAVRMRLVVARRELMGKLESSEDWDASPLLGEPAEAMNSSDLEVYEVLNSFSHGS